MNRFTRREALTRSMGGFGSVVLSWTLHENPLHAAGAPVYDLLPKAPHFAPKARSVIFIFMAGGPSQMDLLDPKPLLAKFDGMEPPVKVVSRCGQTEADAQSVSICEVWPVGHRSVRADARIGVGHRRGSRNPLGRHR